MEIVMAHTLHLQVVTEGVETLEQQQCLESFGCDGLQGYLLSRPVPLRELCKVLDELDQRHASTVNPRMPGPDRDAPGSPGLFPDSPGPHAGASTVLPSR